MSSELEWPSYYDAKARKSYEKIDRFDYVINQSTKSFENSINYKIGKFSQQCSFKNVCTYIIT